MRRLALHLLRRRSDLSVGRAERHDPARRDEFIFAKNLREPVDYRGVENQFRKVRADIAREKPEALDYSLHSLRYVAAIELAEAGRSDSEIQAVTGHNSLAMVQKYRAKASKKRLSKAAQERRERAGE